MLLAVAFNTMNKVFIRKKTEKNKKWERASEFDILGYTKLQTASYKISCIVISNNDVLNFILPLIFYAYQPSMCVIAITKVIK